MPKLTKRGPGRPKGVPNKATTEAKEFARSITMDPEYRANLKQAAIERKLLPAIEAMLWHYGHGKPAETVELHATGTVSVSEVLQALEAGARAQLARGLLSAGKVIDAEAKRIG